MNRPHASRPRTPVWPTVFRFATDAVRRLRRAARGGSTEAGPRPRLREIAALWIVERLPDGWHRHLRPGDGATPLSVDAWKRRR